MDEEEVEALEGRVEVKQKRSRSRTRDSEDFLCEGERESLFAVTVDALLIAWFECGCCDSGALRDSDTLALDGLGSKTRLGCDEVEKEGS